MRNAGLDEAQAGIKIAGRNINNFKYADYMRLNGEVAMCFWILWFQSYSFQTRVGSLNNGQAGALRVSLLCHPSFIWVEGNASAESNSDSLH